MERSALDARLAGPAAEAGAPTPVVSVIMPVWRPRREWLLQAVQSVLAQKDCRLELIVVDDGCDDEPVAELLEGIGDDRLRIRRVEHGGSPRARNAGFRAARGEWIRFVDADDVIEPGSTAHLLGLTRGESDVIAYGATLFCDEDLHPIFKLASALEGPAAIECLLSRFTVTIHSMLFPRGIVEAAGDWEPSIRVSHDWDFVLRTLEHARVRGDGEVATLYRLHDKMSSGDFSAGLQGFRRVIERYFERHPEHRGTLLEREADATFHLFAAEMYGRRHKYGKSVRHFCQALALRPRSALRALAESTLGITRKLQRRLEHPFGRAG